MESMRWRDARDEARGWAGQACEVSGTIARTLTFTLSAMGNLWRIVSPAAIQWDVGLSALSSPPLPHAGLCAPRDVADGTKGLNFPFISLELMQISAEKPFLDSGIGKL